MNHYMGRIAMAEFQRLWADGPVFAQAEHVRLSTDCVLLADFVRAERARRGIDLGCASGAIALLLLWRNPALHMTGLELQREAAALAEENMERNGLTERSRIVAGDIRRHRELFAGGSFDLVAANPPYYPLGSGALSPDPARAGARGETDCSLEELCAAAAWLLRTGGSFFLVYRPERLAELSAPCTAPGWSPSGCAWSAIGRRPRPAWCWRRDAGAADRDCAWSRHCFSQGRTAERARSTGAFTTGDTR